MENEQPFTASNPRRSSRARSLVTRFSPDHYPRLKIEKELEKPQTGPRHSRSKSLNLYKASEAPAEASLQHFNHFNEEMRQGVGQIRIPLVTEVHQMGKIMLQMRHIEIKFIEAVIETMKEENIQNHLIETMTKGLNILKWEVDPNNIKQDDLPPLGTNNYVDISTFLIIFFEKIHENMHRISDMESCLNMLSDERRAGLKTYTKEAAKLFFVEWRNFVNGLEIHEYSRKKYQNVKDGIFKNCESCSPKER